MKILRHDQADFSEQLAKELAGSSLFDPGIEERARYIIADVQSRGDAALFELTERFDKIKLDQLALTGPIPRVTADLQRAIAAAQRNIASFAKKSLRKNWWMRNAQGATVGESFEPFERVGLYIPGGTAPLVSTALMTITLAKVAGCPEIVVCTPPPVNPNLLYAIRKAGATEVFQIGGAQAIAALSLGTATIKRVQKVFGPGNAYVVAAKRLLFGHVAVDLLPGPSEVLVLADDSANPAWVAADMLAQAEHGSGHERVWLVTTSQRVFDETPQAACPQTAALKRADFIRQALENHCVLVLAKNLRQAIAITNQFAPEHCELMVKNPEQVMKRIKTAGAIFIGPWSPTVVGDYLAGPSHTLPTGGAGRSFSGLTVDQFQRRTSVVKLNAKALKKSLPALETFAAVEGLDAHAVSARKRFE